MVTKSPVRRHAGRPTGISSTQRSVFPHRDVGRISHRPTPFIASGVGHGLLRIWTDAFRDSSTPFTGWRSHDSGGTYGSPKIWITLVRKGWRVWVNTVAKIMAELGRAGRKIRRRRGLTRRGRRSAAPDFVRRDFTADAPDQVWCGDMTEIETGEGRLCLATVIDLFSRRLLGCAMGARRDAELVVAALHMAVATRGGDVKGVAFEMQGPWRDFDQVERAIFQWVTWYNEERLHSALDYVPPAEYEQDFWWSQDQVPQSA
ncbi:transposase [Streptomyces scopuliridis]|uniref:transposase n=1 Tax=Streptomyces scopuliridis TaxID=452529 RepID=UPI00368ED8E8